MVVAARKEEEIHLLRYISNNSDIVECQDVSTHKNYCLEEVVFNHGFRLENIFLRPYANGCATKLLQDSNGFNLEELLKVLILIDFKGKIVLENTQAFYHNVDVLDAALKKVGFAKRKTGDLDLIE